MKQEQLECKSIEGPRKLERSSCFACSPSNSRGLKLDFRVDEGGKMAAQWLPNADFEGFRGIAHGGIVSTVLDEAMAKAVAATGADALTAEMRVRFRHEVSTAIPVLVQGWIVDVLNAGGAGVGGCARVAVGGNGGGCISGAAVSGGGLRVLAAKQGERK